MLGNHEPFSPEALPTNRTGRLTDAQQQIWQGIADDRRKSVRSLAYPFGAIGALLLIVNAPPSKALTRDIAGAAFLIVAASLLAFAAAGRDALSVDAREGRVEMVEGAIAKRRGPATKTGTRRCYLDIARHRLRTGITAFDAAPDAGIVRAFYLPHSKRVVNLERLPDRPLPSGGSPSSEILGHLTDAWRSHDEVALAEARAAAAALKNEVTSQLHGAPVRPESAPRDPQALREAVCGSWRNPLFTVTFAADGTVTMAAGAGAIRRGHWSIDANGRLVADAMGRQGAADAWVTDDRLTVVLDGRAIKFTRVAPI